MTTPRRLAGASAAMSFFLSNVSGYDGFIKAVGEYSYSSSHNRVHSVNTENTQTAVGWGNEIEGLSASLVSDKAEFRYGEPILVRFHISNTGKRTKIVAHSGFWPDHKLVVENAMRAALPLTALGQETRAAFGSDIERRKNFDVALAPGEIDIPYGPFDLRDYFQIGNATTLYVRCLYALGSTEVWSNELILRIR